MVLVYLVFVLVSRVDDGRVVGVVGVVVGVGVVVDGVGDVGVVLIFMVLV